MSTPEDHTQSGIMYYGDNLEILNHRDANGEFDYIRPASIDVVYLDPPFQSGRDYNIFFRDTNGRRSTAQVMAFKDTWSWTPETANLYQQFINDASTPPHVAELLRTFCGDEARAGSLAGTSMAAYLVNMAPRLLALHRVLKPTGLLFLHCDPRSSRYLAVLLDSIFNIKNFRAEIAWHHGLGAFRVKRNLPSKHDTILMYSVTDNYKFNILRGDVTEQMLRKYSHIDEHGRYMMSYGKKYYLKGGKPIDDVWEIPALAPTDSERLGYPTQKPLQLLERIIEMSTDPMDTVLDPFCGCGTAIEAAQKLGRRWVGIDITHLAVSLLRYRLSKYPNVKFNVIGEPVDMAGAQALAQQDRYQFQWWALSLIGAIPYGGKKKGKDKGIDGIRVVHNPASNMNHMFVVSIKSGTVNASMVRDLIGTVSSANINGERPYGGIMITLKRPTRDMIAAAAQAGSIPDPWGYKRHIPKVQILTIEQLLQNNPFSNMPQLIERWQEMEEGTKEQNGK